MLIAYDDKCLAVETFKAGVVTVVYRARVVGRKPSPGVESQCVEAFRPSEIPWEELAFRSSFQALRDWVKSLSKKGH